MCGRLLQSNNTQGECYSHIWERTPTSRIEKELLDMATKQHGFVDQRLLEQAYAPKDFGSLKAALNRLVKKRIFVNTEPWIYRLV